MRRRNSFTMLAFDGLHGSGDDVGVLLASSLIRVQPTDGIGAAQFIDPDGLTALTSHSYTNVDPVLVRTSTPVSVFRTADGKFRTAMPVIVMTQEPVRMVEKNRDTFSTVIAPGTSFALTVNAIVEITSAAPGSTVADVPVGSGKPFPWIPIVIGTAAVGLTVWFLRRKRGGRR